MKSIKKVFAVAMIVTMFAAMSLMTMAAMTAEKQALLNQAIAKGADLGITGTADWDSYMSKARVFLTQEDLDAKQISQLKASIDDTAKLMETELAASGSLTFQDMIKNNKAKFDQITSKVMTAVQKDLSAAGIQATFTGNGDLDVVGPSGQKYTFSPASPIKTTGVNATATVVVVLGLTAVLGACVVVSKKRALVK